MKLDALYDILEARRVELEMTYEDLSRRVGVSRQAIFRFFTNQKSISQDAFCLLAKALKLDIINLSYWYVKRYPQHRLLKIVHAEYESTLKKLNKRKCRGETDPYKKLPKGVRVHKKFRKLKKPAEI